MVVIRAITCLFYHSQSSNRHRCRRRPQIHCFIFPRIIIYGLISPIIFPRLVSNQYLNDAHRQKRESRRECHLGLKRTQLQVEELHSLLLHSN